MGKKLSPEQGQVFQYIKGGWTFDQIKSEYGWSSAHLNTQLRSIYKKTSTTSFASIRKLGEE